MFGWLRRQRRGEGRTSAPMSNIMSGTAHDVVQAHRIDQVVVTAPPERDDVQILRDVTDANLRALEQHSGLPSAAGRSVVARSETQELSEVEGSFVITGEPGCGKSGVVFRLAVQLQKRGEDMVLLTVETLGEASGAVRGDVALTGGLGAVLADWPGEGRGTVLIDGLDASRRDSLGWLANLVTDLAGSRWRVVATMRRFDLIHSTAWRQAFAGRPVVDSDERRDRRLDDVRHFVLGDFQPPNSTNWPPTIRTSAGWSMAPTFIFFSSYGILRLRGRSAALDRRWGPFAAHNGPGRRPQSGARRATQR